MEAMGREERTMGSSYREFSRRRYAELKEEKNNKLRESEIIQKIIREWDDMRTTKRGRQSNTYTLPDAAGAPNRLGRP